MPQASPELQLLRGLTKSELQAIPDRCDWCHVRETDQPFSELSKRIRDSIERNVSKSELTYSEAMSDIRKQVILPGPETVAQKIRTRLRETPVAKSVGSGAGSIEDREEWYITQLYGAIDTALVRPYNVKLEYELNQRNRPTPDIYVESEEGEGDFIIEVRVAKSNLSISRIEKKLHKYHRSIRQDREQTRELSFLCIVGEDQDLPTIDESRKSTPVSEYMDVPKSIEDIEDDMTGVEVVTNTFN